MKRVILLLITSMLITELSQAQSNESTKTFIRSVVHEEGKILYVDSISNNTINEMQEALNKDTISNVIITDKRGKRIVFDFTKKEREYINSELKKMRNYAWSEGLLKNSILLRQDTIGHIFSMKAMLFDKWGYFKSHYGQGFHYFSKPIFLRNNTVCIFYEDYNCGWTCGDGSLNIYVKKGDKWIVKYILYTWDS
jgi:hypothetical protein